MYYNGVKGQILGPIFMKETQMTMITLESLTTQIRNARAQEEQYRANMNAAAGAAQAYEQLLTGLVNGQRKEAMEKAAALSKDGSPQPSETGISVLKAKKARK